MKKIIGFAIGFLFIGALLFAQTENDFTVTLTDDNAGVRITKYNGRETTTVRIPATIQGMPVREIGEEAFRQNKLGNTIILFEVPSSVIIPEGVIKIEKGAFALSGLTSISLPETITEIGNWAFQYCRLLRSVTLPPKLKVINSALFDRCDNLASITIPEGVTTIGNEAFGHCGSLLSLSLPSAIT